MSEFLSPKLYAKRKAQVLRLTNATQRMEKGKPHRGYTDAEIAQRFGITEREAADLRTIAELDAVEVSRFLDADAWKQERLERKKVGGADSPGGPGGPGGSAKKTARRAGRG
jgi:hypothetical protein